MKEQEILDFVSLLKPESIGELCEAIALKDIGNQNTVLEDWFISVCNRPGVNASSASSIITEWVACLEIAMAKTRVNAELAARTERMHNAIRNLPMFEGKKQFWKPEAHAFRP